jgi:hypothetical protein
MFKKRIIEEKTKSVHNPILTKVGSTPKPVQKYISKEDCCMDECECPVCFDDKQLNQLLHDTNKKNYKSCGHYVCEECIIGIMKNKQTEDCVCPICRKPFTHYGCSDDIKAVDDYEVVFSQEAFNDNFPKNSLMRSLKRGGKTRRRRLRRRRTNKRK